MSGDPLPTPSEFIKAELERHQMLPSDLALVLGVSSQAVGQLLLGRRGISADMARALGEAFGVDAERILSIQKASEVATELARARKPDPRIAKTAKLVSTYPVREMIKRGWIDASNDTLSEQVCRFFGVSSIDEQPVLAHAAKKTSYDSITPSQLAWLFRANEIAREMVVPAYSESALRRAIQRLLELRVEPEEARHVPRTIAEAGVRLVLVQALPGAKIDGACFWLDQKSPVVAMSLRFDRIDNFWFVLRHELEHVLQGDGRDGDIMVDDLDISSSDDALPAIELRANEAASDFCVAKKEFDSWILRKAPFFSEKDLIGFSRRIGIHPGIVAGQLRRKINNYRLFSKFLVKVQDHVLPSATVDGWGHIAPTMRGS